MKIKQFVFNGISENSYLIWDEESKDAAVIDSGMETEGERKEFCDFVQKEGLKLRMALQTHTHFDHIYGLPFIKEKFGICPLFHKLEEQVYYSQPQMVAMFGMSMDCNLPRPERFIEDNEVIYLSNIEIRVIHTPGHTPGGVCFYIEKEGILLSGDTMFMGSMGRYDLPGGNFRTEMNSITNRLLVLPEETRVLCGHGPSTTIGQEKRQY